jgi:sec-independent protein translocase protein TatA
MGLDNPLHIAFLLVILLLVFGAKRLPELGRSLGSGMRGFKESISGESSSTRHIEELPEAPTPAAAIQANETAVERPPVQPVA